MVAPTEADASFVSMDVMRIWHMRQGSSVPAPTRWMTGVLAPNRSARERSHHFRGRIQPVDATVWLNISAGVWKPRVFLGLSFNCRAIALSLACEWLEMSIPLGL